MVTGRRLLSYWRGGSTVALVVQECLAYLGVPADHTTIRTSYGGAPNTSNPWRALRTSEYMAKVMRSRR